MKNLKPCFCFGAMVMLAGTLVANAAVADKSVRVPSENSVPVEAVPAEVARPGDLASQSVPAEVVPANAVPADLPDFALTNYEKTQRKIAKLKIASEQGDDEAAIELAEIYAEHWNPERNPEKAREILENLAARGNAHAMAVWAKIDAQDVRAPVERERELMRAAAEGGYAPAMLYMASCTPSPNDWLVRAAEAGDFHAQMKLARNYELASGGFEQNDEKAFFWYKKAAETGNANALFETGLRLETGAGTPKNLDEAQQYYRRAAQQGSWQAWERWKKFLTAGTPNPGLPHTFFGVPLLEEFVTEKPMGMGGGLATEWWISTPLTVDFAGTTWRMSILRKKDFKIAYGVRISRNLDPMILTEEVPKFQRALDELTQKYGEFLVKKSRVPADSPNHRWDFEKKIVGFTTETPKFSDGRVVISTDFNSRGYQISFILRDENWDEKHKKPNHPPGQIGARESDEFVKVADKLSSAGTPEVMAKIFASMQKEKVEPQEARERLRGLRMKFAGMLSQKFGDEPAKMLEIYEQSGWQKIEGAKLSDSLRERIANGTKFLSRERYRGDIDNKNIARERRILREIIQLENSRER